MVVEYEMPIQDPMLQEDPFLKAIKALGGKALEGIPLFSEKIDLEVLME